MKICITLDDVLRAKTRQIGKMLVKAGMKSEEDIEGATFETNDYCKEFRFEDKRAYNKFMYDDYPFEVFAEAPVMERMLDKKLNLWILGLANEKPTENWEFMIANPYEFNTSIGYTCFFLSQVATRIREFYFPLNSSDIWNRCDVLITADPKLLAEKPEGKVAIKIDAPYNTESEADFTYESLMKLIEDKEIGEKLNGKIY